MNNLIILKWNLKNDIHCWQTVLGCYTGIESMRTLAKMLYKSGKCGSIQIVSDTASMIEDWSKGILRTSTDIFNEQLREILEGSGAA